MNLPAFVMLGLDPSIHAVTIRTVEAVQDRATGADLTTAASGLPEHCREGTAWILGLPLRRFTLAPP